MIDWYNQSDEMPFAHALSQLPFPKKIILVQPSTATDVKTKPNTGPNIIMSSLAIQKSHIPPFLPLFPDKRTYLNSPIFVERETDLRKIRKKKVEQNRKVEQALTRLQREAIEPGEIGDDKSDTKSEKKRRCYYSKKLQKSCKFIGASGESYAILGACYGTWNFLAYWQIKKEKKI